MGLSWLKRKGVAKILLRHSPPIGSENKGFLPDTTYRRESLETWRRQVFLYTGSGCCLLRNKDREKTGFACELGLYQWKRMPFGLCNATATFHRLMAQALTRVTKKHGNIVMCYVDDVVTATPTLADQIDRLDEVFDCIK